MNSLINLKNLSVAKIRKLLKDEESKFRLFTSLKMTSIPVVTLIILFFLFFLLLQMDLLFFRANELIKMDNFVETFYDYLFDKSSDYLPYVALMIIFINVASIYVSDILLRPFRILGEYCEKRVNGEKTSYNPDFFNDLSLMTRFSEYFFSVLETAFKSGSYKPVDIPTKYTKFHRPKFETIFFLHYTLYLAISFIAVTGFMYVYAMNLHDGLINLAQQTLASNSSVSLFLREQTIVFQNCLLGIIVVEILMYAILASHLYLKVSAPAFGVFATMRSFLKGNYSARVHLIGFSYLRAHCRKLNKYLDNCEREINNLK